MKHEIKISDVAGNFAGELDDSDFFGGSLAGIVDYNEDGFNDLLVSAGGDDDGGTDKGAFWILTVDTSGVKWHSKISSLSGGFSGQLDDSDHFGTVVGFVGDLDGNHIIDVGAGAPEDDDGGTDRGAVWILLMDSTGIVQDHFKISSTTSNFGSGIDDADAFGSEIRGVGDLNNDQMLDLAIGARFDDDGGTDRGAIWLLLTELPSVKLVTSAFLSGAYGGFDLMSMGIPFELARPKFHPYADPQFIGTPLYLPEVDTLSVLPDSTTDWVLVELRTAEDSLEQAAIEPAVIRRDGSIVAADGDSLRFNGLGLGQYWAIVRHRNHLPVMSSSPLDFSAGFAAWDFTTSMSQAFSSGGAPMKDLGDGNFGLFACDANADGFVTAPDFNLWSTATTSGASGYEQADCNMDGFVSAPDFNLWNSNTTAGAASQVPD